MHVGGQAVKTEITPNERKICDALSADLINYGLFFVGIDVASDVRYYMSYNSV